MIGENLSELSLKPFTTNEIKPIGWLLRQLQIQAEGLSGNLDKFWPDIKESKWVGGDKEGWERVPYWLDGFIPLANGVGDQTLAFIFPTLEQSMRKKEYLNEVEEDGKMNFRSFKQFKGSWSVHAAADGQMGTITRVYR
ncbi:MULTISPECIES: hypothetical protein [Metabacillus]|uniref:Uncharacterized protein n=2 Tax=Metabacillus TaxID=2675233 RepID=A0A179T028_9BACI|nr:MULTISPECIES: hypothetical protein [Metabacillus]OAS85883.1 hypothetical protein A6K24_23080 [Metabacillus litoralis]QNF30092.1 hypothetical protein HUW50_23060 [Metabacillus sp. KUDC1714]